MSARYWRAVGQAVIGIGWVLVGALRQICTRPAYPPGDWRGDPTISAVVNGGIIVVGITLILAAAILVARDLRSTRG